jgi:PAS domain S-box-containing protein
METLDDFGTLLPAVVTNFPSAVIIVDASSNIQFSNDVADNLFGYERNELQGLSIESVLPELFLQTQTQSRAVGRHKADGDFAVNVSLTRIQAGVPGIMWWISLGPESRGDAPSVSGHIDQAAAGYEALAALATIDEFVVVLDRQWRYLFVNNALLEHHQLEKNNVVGRRYWDVFPDMIGMPVDHILREAFAAPQKRTIEQYDPSAHMWYQINIVSTQSTITVHARDITSLKRASELNRQLMRSLDTMSDPIFMMDRRWRYAFMNLAAAEFVQRERDELMGHNIWEMSPWLRETPFGRGCYRAMESSESFNIEEYYEPRERWLNVHYLPHADGFTVHITDISVLKRSELQINQLLTGRATIAHMQKVFDLMPTPMLILDPEFRYIYANTAALRGNNHQAEELIGAQMGELNPAVLGTEFERRIRLALESGERQRFVVQLPPTGKWFQVEAIPLESHVILAAVDISKQKQSEQSVDILTESLDRALDGGWDRPTARDTGPGRD